MGKFKEMDLLRQEREAFDADYPMEPTPRADMWIAWNSEDGFTLWDNFAQAVLWSARDSVEWPVQYVMQKAQQKLPVGTKFYATPPAAPVQEAVAQIYVKNGHWIDTPRADVKGLEDGLHSLYTTPPAAPVPVQSGRNHYEDGDVFERIAAMKKPAAPVQEPVAWINAKGDMTYLHGPYNKDDRPLIYGDITPHAAQPAPWVGLIDENGVLDLEDAHVTTEFIRGVLWAQSRLKEKNK